MEPSYSFQDKRENVRGTSQAKRNLLALESLFVINLSGGHLQVEGDK